MDWITTSGNSIDEAKSHALDQLGIVADEAEFDVVNDVQKGLFGKVKVEARVRARVRPKAPAAKEERGRRGGGGGGGNRNRSRDGNKSGGNKGGGNKRDAGANKNGGKGGSGKGDSSRQKGQSDNRGGRGGGGNRKGKGNDSSGSRTADESKQTTEKAPARQQARKQDPVTHEFSRAEQERVAADFLSGVLERFELEGSVAVDPEPAEDDAIEVAVTGQELGLLVGQKGVTLNALQELTRTVVQRAADGAKTERLRVDVAGYRERRRAALQDFAGKIANDVIDSGEEKVLEPMGPADRKVVHDTVNDMDGVETGSEGEEPRRRVVIRPI